MFLSSRQNTLNAHSYRVKDVPKHLSMNHFMQISRVSAISWVFLFFFFFFASILLYNVIKVGIVHLKMKILLFTQAQVFSNKRKIFCRMSVTRELMDPHSRKKKYNGSQWGPSTVWHTRIYLDI